MSQRPLRSMATTSSLQDPTNGIVSKFPFSQPLTTSSLPNDDGIFPRQPPRQPPERNFINIAPLLDSTLDFETTYIENSLHVPDDEDDFKNNQTTYLTVINDADDVSDEASSIESSQDVLFSEIDKAVALKCKEFVKQGLLKPNPAEEDIADVIHAELQPYEVEDAEEIEQLKGLAVNSDGTPEDLLGSNSDSLFDLDFDSLVKNKKARIVEPRFQMTLAELLDESKMVSVSVYGNFEVDSGGIQHDSRLANSGDTGKFVFTTSQILRMAKKLGQLAMLDYLQLLHFHIGYQISITELLAAGVGEASQIYCELLRFGAQMKVFDIGGGLGIDYDGSKSADSDIFVAHDLEEYVVAVVQAVKDVCDCRSAKHPVICSDSGMPIASHHSKPSKSDLNYESGLDPELSLNIYVQRYERFGHLKMSDFLAYTLKSIVQVLKPELEFLFDSPPKEFDSFEDVLKLYESGMDVPEGLLKDVRNNIHGEMLKVIFSTVSKKFLKFHGFPTKKVISQGECHSEFSQLVSYIFMYQIFNIVTSSSHATTVLLLDTHYNVAVRILKNDIEFAVKTYRMMSQLWFMHAFPTLLNAGTPKAQLSSYFLICMKDDSIEGIYDTLKECTAISKSAGGIGVYVHNIRAYGSYICGTKGTSNGIIPMLRVFNDTTHYVDQGRGKRKGAFAVYLEPWHGDIVKIKKCIDRKLSSTYDLYMVYTGTWLSYNKKLCFLYKLEKPKAIHFKVRRSRILQCFTHGVIAFIKGWLFTLVTQWDPGTISPLSYLFRTLRTRFM